MNNRITAGIVGAAGYTGGELIRILIQHPNVDLKFVLSRSSAGKYVHDLHSDLIGETNIKFSSDLEYSDVLFLCLPHKESKPWLESNTISNKTKVVDLGNDFRINCKLGDREFIYGLPEFQRERIKSADLVANTGCFASAIQYALLPLASEKLLSDVFVTGITGSTGAGVKPQETTHFSWRNNNVSAYKTLTHQHLDEIKQTLKYFNDTSFGLHFVPWRGDFPRGIFVSASMHCDKSLEELQEIFKKFYFLEPFVWVSEKNINMKQVVNSNKCVIFLEKKDDILVVHSAIDNLLKGASGQAIQNMNIMFGFEESLGLKLKTLAY